MLTSLSVRGVASRVGVQRKSLAERIARTMFLPRVYGEIIFIEIDSKYRAFSTIEGFTCFACLFHGAAAHPHETSDACSAVWRSQMCFVFRGVVWINDELDATIPKNVLELASQPVTIHTVQKSTYNIYNHKHINSYKPKGSQGCEKNLANHS